MQATWDLQVLSCAAIVFGGLCQSVFGQNTSSDSAAAPLLPTPASRKVDFLKEIRPILSEDCYECHGPQKQKGALRLDQKAAALKGGDSGPALVPGNSAESLLVQVVSGAKADLDRMPKKRDPLTSEQISLLRA